MEIAPIEITGVENVIQNENEKAVLRSFTIDGKIISQPQKGMNILKISDGTVRKIMVQ